MKSKQSGLRTAPRMLLFSLIAVLLVVTMWIPTAGANSVSDLSMYERASEVTRQFSSALAPGADAKALNLANPGEDGVQLTAGNAGGLLGYAEVLEGDTGVIGWLMNSYTTASATITYDQLENIVPSNSSVEAGKSNPFFQYAGYGEALTEMGLINTIRPGSANTIGAPIATGIVVVVYLLANAAPFLFQSALFLLSALNPFKLFMTVIEGTGNMELGILSEVADYVGGIYLVVQDLSITILFPMMLALMLVSVLMFRSTSAMKKFSRYGLRVFMLFAGLPIIGATYTGVVEGLNSEVETGADYANYLVLSSYVDFENWVRESRLAPPASVAGLAIKNPRTATDAATERMGLSDRALVLDINGKMARNPVAFEVSERYNATSDISAILSKGGDKVNVNDDGFVKADTKSAFSSTMNLLSRHMQTTLYSGSQYDGEISGRIQKIRSAENNETDGPIIKMFTLTSSDDRTWGQVVGFRDEFAKYGKAVDWQESNGLFTPGKADAEDFQFGNYAYNIYNGGSLTTNGSAYMAAGIMPTDDGLQPIGNSAQGVVGGLSPLAMYNFLNTTFTDSGLTVYSANKSTTDISRDSYTSVSFAGSGVSAWVRWLENVVVMLSLASLSIAYGVMMLTAAIKNIPRILTSVFGTALGSIQFATKLLISTAVMIIQVVGMIFLYTLSENIIMTLLLNFNSVTSSVSSYFGAGTVALEFTRGLLVIGVTAFVTYQLIKNMNVFREMMEEVVTNSINRVMGVLDTSTGGQGMDVSKTSGGRVGGDGKMSDTAKADDAKGMGGLANAFAGGGLLGGAAGLLGAAHDVEARREQAEQEKQGGAPLNPDGTLKTTKDKIGNRLKTAKDLAAARMKDAGKSGVGIEGKSLAREMQAKDQAISAIALRDGITPKDDPTKDNAASDVATNGFGQALDADGNVKRDEHGNALDAKGKPISSNAPLGVATHSNMGADGIAAMGTQAMTDKDGKLLDSDGNAYLDENGNAFRQDSRGRLIDENGAHMALDKDGVMKPISEIPGHNGKPLSAQREAAKLDNMRFDADKFAAMKDVQDASHYGLDKDGQVTDDKGQALMARTATGVSPVTMDANGYIADKDGNRVKSSDLNGVVDPRGFEEVTDPDTGEKHMKHKGDSAMKPLAASAAIGAAASQTTAKKKPKSLTELANASSKANDLSQRADARVADLRAKGASPYAINQAERFADKAKTNANAVQKAYSGALKEAGTNPQAKALRAEPVTQRQVSAAYDISTKSAEAVTSEVAKLEEMNASGAPAKALTNQRERIATAQQEAHRAHNVADDSKTAMDTGRSFGEVNQARNTLQRAEQVFAKRQDALETAVQEGAAPAVIKQREQAMQKASAAVTTARSNTQRMAKPPSGSPEQIDLATAQHTQAQQQHAKAARRVERLENQGSPEAIQQAKTVEQQAQKKVQQTRAAIGQAEQQVQRLEEANAPRSQIVAAKRDVEKAAAQAQTAQRAHVQARQQVQQVENSKPSQVELTEAKREEQIARRTVKSAARTRQSVTSPKGWTANEVPTIQPVPAVSPTRSFATLSADGINNYGHYQERVTQQAETVKSMQSQVQQARQRLAAMKSSNRPPQIVKKAQQEVQTLSAKAAGAQTELASLQDNAQGLLKTSRFQPTVANRPIRKNGAIVVNQLVNLGNTQSMLDNLAYQSDAGTLSDAGKRQMTSLTARIGHMKRELVSTGIREDALKDTPTITKSTRHMQQSWDAFVNGTSEERSE